MGTPCWSQQQQCWAQPALLYPVCKLADRGTPVARHRRALLGSLLPVSRQRSWDRSPLPVHPALLACRGLGGAPQRPPAWEPPAGLAARDPGTERRWWYAWRCWCAGACHCTAEAPCLGAACSLSSNGPGARRGVGTPAGTPAGRPQKLPAWQPPAGLAAELLGPSSGGLPSAGLIQGTRRSQLPPMWEPAPGLAAAVLGQGTGGAPGASTQPQTSCTDGGCRPRAGRRRARECSSGG